MNRRTQEKYKGILQSVLGNYPIRIKDAFARQWQKESELKKPPLYVEVLEIHKSGHLLVKCDTTGAEKKIELNVISPKFLY